MIMVSNCHNHVEINSNRTGSNSQVVGLGLTVLVVRVEGLVPRCWPATGEGPYQKHPRFPQARNPVPDRQKHIRTRTVTDTEKDTTQTRTQTRTANTDKDASTDRDTDTSTDTDMDTEMHMDMSTDTHTHVHTQGQHR